MNKIFLIFFSAILVTVQSGCSALFFYPQKDHINNPLITEFTYEDIYFSTSDGMILHGWFLKTKIDSKDTILFLHGNAENISTHVNNILWLVNNGYDVFAFDYRGFGKSEGYPEINWVHLDAQAAV